MVGVGGERCAAGTAASTGSAAAMLGFSTAATTATGAAAAETTDTEAAADAAAAADEAVDQRGAAEEIEESLSKVRREPQVDKEIGGAVEGEQEVVDGDDDAGVIGEPFVLDEFVEMQTGDEIENVRQEVHHHHAQRHPDGVGDAGGC